MMGVFLNRLKTDGKKWCGFCENRYIFSPTYIIFSLFSGLLPPPWKNKNENKMMWFFRCPLPEIVLPVFLVGVCCESDGRVFHQSCSCFVCLFSCLQGSFVLCLFRLVCFLFSLSVFCLCLFVFGRFYLPVRNLYICRCLYWTWNAFFSFCMFWLLLFLFSLWCCLPVLFCLSALVYYLLFYFSVLSFSFVRVLFCFVCLVFL